MWRVMIALILAVGTDGSRIPTSCIVGSKDCEGASSFNIRNGITRCCKNGARVNYIISNNNGVDNSQCLCLYGDHNRFTIVNDEFSPLPFRQDVYTFTVSADKNTLITVSGR